MPDAPINLAVVGYGYWGPNIVRNVLERPELRFWGLCEMSHERVAKFEGRYPGMHACASFDEVLADPTVDAVSIATPPATHYALAEKALLAGKHVLVEKPLTTTAAEADALIVLTALPELASTDWRALVPARRLVVDACMGVDRGKIESAGWTYRGFAVAR